MEALEFSELKSQYDSAGAAVFGISPDPADSHKKFAEKFNLSVQLLSDPAHKVIEAYGAWGLKKKNGGETVGVIRSSVLIDPVGVVRFVWPAVTAKGHAAEVLAELKNLSAAAG